MFELLIEDVVSDILCYCDALTLGKLSLTLREAPVQVWGLAPIFDLPIGFEHWELPYFLRAIQLTGPRTRHIYLPESMVISSQSLHHVSLHCVHLQQLRICALNFYPYLTNDGTWSLLLSRLNSLVVCGMFGKVQLRSLFEIVCAASGTRLEHLQVDCNLDSRKPREYFRLMIEHLAPSLRSVHAPLPLNARVLNSLFSVCGRLEKLTIDLRFSPTATQASIIDCIRALADTKVGMNLHLKTAGGPETIVSYWMEQCNVSFRQIVAALKEAGINHTFHPTIMPSVLKTETSENFEALVDLLESGNCPLLPPLPEIAAEVHKSDFWSCTLTVPTCSRPILDRLVRMFGLPSCRLLGKISDAETMLWFIRTVGREPLNDVISHLPLHNRVEIINGFVNHEMMIETICDELRDRRLLVMRGDDLILALKANLRVDGKAKVLPMIVEATGWDNISPEAKGFVMWTLSFKYCCQLQGECQPFKYWLDQVSMNGAQAPILLQDGHVDLIVAMVCRYQSYGVLAFLTVVRRVEDRFLGQFESLSRNLAVQSKLCDALSSFDDRIHIFHAADWIFFREICRSLHAICLTSGAEVKSLTPNYSE